MSDAEDTGLLAIDVDPDNYAETAAGDAPSTVSRTHQSEADFQAIKATYHAKQHDGNIYAELLKALPELAKNGADGAAANQEVDAALKGGNAADKEAGGSVKKASSSKPKIGKKEWQLFGYAVGEMYYDGKYADVLGLCERARERFAVDGKMEGSLGRWCERARGRVEGGW